MKTLQQQYLLIKEGKGNKDYFLKQARNLFPEFITVNSDYTTAVHVLKSKSILSEGIGGIASINPNSKPDWFKIFDTNLKEAVGVKNTKEYGDQNEFEKIDKEVQDALDHNFDNKDEKNIDNVYGQSFLMGYYTEMKDPKNANKTVDELKQIVLKNMVKDVTYYSTKAFMGTKNIGFTKDVVGGGDPVAPKGKYKSSGYGDMPKAKTVKEGLVKENQNIRHKIKKADGKEKIVFLPKKYTIKNDTDEKNYDIYDELKLNVILAPGDEIYPTNTESLNEAKKSNVHSRIKDLEKQNEVLALESKITALEEAINELTQKVSLSESDDLAEMMDPKKINELKKDIKILEKYKITCEKKLSKLGGKKAVVDNEEMTEEITEGVTVLKGGILRRIDPQNGDKSYNVAYDDFSEEIISVSHDDWDKINDIYQKAKNG